jgi:hypothetical protein
MEEKVKKTSYDSEILAREDSWYHKELLVRIFLRVTVAIGLLIGGLVLLAMRLPGWSVIFGLPMIVFGSVFIIYTYDEVLSRKLEPHNMDKESHTNDR